MINFFFNKDTNTLSIFSETGENYIVNNDNVHFNKILSICKKESSVFEDIKSLLCALNFFNYQNSDIKVYNDGYTVFIEDDNGMTVKLPSYLQKHIAGSNVPIEKYSAFFNCYVKTGLASQIYDSMLKNALFAIVEDGRVLLFAKTNDKQHILLKSQADGYDADSFTFMGLGPVLTSTIDISDLGFFNYNDNFYRIKHINRIKFIGQTTLDYIYKGTFNSQVIEKIFNIYKEFWNSYSLSFYKNKEMLASRSIFELVEEISNATEYLNNDVLSVFDAYSPEKTIIQLMRC